ncbi:MAG: hypothetical protein WB245_09870 [Acidimicrobiia bacterium]
MAITISVAGFVLFRPSAAEATLSDIAQAARRAAPGEIPAGSFGYTRSEHVDLITRPGTDFDMEEDNVAYLLSSTREVWRSPAERYFQLRTTAHTAEFFDPTAETAYYRAHVNEADGLGTIRIEEFTDVTDDLIETSWPTESDELQQAMEDYAGSASTFDLVSLGAEILGETNPSPALRGAIVEVFTMLPDLAVDKDEDSVVVSAVDDPVSERVSVTLSGQGDLLAVRVVTIAGYPSMGIPAGTLISQTEYVGRKVVADLPDVPYPEVARSGVEQLKSAYRACYFKAGMTALIVWGWARLPPDLTRDLDGMVADFRDRPLDVDRAQVALLSSARWNSHRPME